MTPKEQLKIVGLLAIGILLVWGVLTTLLPPISTYPPELAEKIAMFYMAWLGFGGLCGGIIICLLYTSPSPRDRQRSRMPSSA